LLPKLWLVGWLVGGTNLEWDRQPGLFQVRPPPLPGRSTGQVSNKKEFPWEIPLAAILEWELVRMRALHGEFRWTILQIRVGWLR
jgi:hypothetical protein